jgi:hypothetical protein
LELNFASKPSKLFSVLREFKLGYLLMLNFVSKPDNKLAMFEKA